MRITSSTATTTTSTTHAQDDHYKKQQDYYTHHYQTPPQPRELPLLQTPPPPTKRLRRKHHRRLKQPEDQEGPSLFFSPRSSSYDIHRDVHTRTPPCGNNSPLDNHDTMYIRSHDGVWGRTRATLGPSRKRPFQDLGPGSSGMAKRHKQPNAAFPAGCSPSAWTSWSCS